MSEQDTQGAVVDMHNHGMNKLEIASELAQQGWVFYDALEFTASVYESECCAIPFVWAVRWKRCAKSRRLILMCSAFKSSHK